MTRPKVAARIPLQAQARIIVNQFEGGVTVSEEQQLPQWQPADSCCIMTRRLGDGLGPVKGNENESD